MNEKERAVIERAKWIAESFRYRQSIGDVLTLNEALLIIEVDDLSHV